MSAFESSMVDSKVQKALYSKMVAVNRQTPSSKPIDNIPHGTFSDLKSSLDSAQTFLPRDIIGATPNDTNPFEQQILRSVYCKVSADVVDKKTKKIMNFASYMTGGPGGGEETTQANRPISFKDTITPNSNSYRGDTGITSVSVTQKSYFLNEITINYTCPDPMDFESRIQPIFLKHGRLIVVEFGFGVNESEFTSLSVLGAKTMKELTGENGEIVKRNQKFPDKYQVFMGQVTKYTFEATDYGGYSGNITIVSKGQNVLNSPIQQGDEDSDLKDEGLSNADYQQKFKELEDKKKQNLSEATGIDKNDISTATESKTKEDFQNSATSFKATINRLEDVVEDYLKNSEPTSIDVEGAKPLRYRYFNGVMHYWIGYNIDFKPEEIDILTENQQKALQGYPDLQDKFKKETKWWKKAQIALEIGVKGAAAVTTDFLIGNGQESTIVNLVKKGAAQAGESLLEAHLNDKEKKSQHLVTWGWFEDHILNSFFQIRVKNQGQTSSILQEIRSVHKPYLYEVDSEETKIQKRKNTLANTEARQNLEVAEAIAQATGDGSVIEEQEDEQDKVKLQNANGLMQIQTNFKNYVNNRCNNSKVLQSLGLNSIIIPGQNTGKMFGGERTARTLKAGKDAGRFIVGGATGIAVGLGLANPASLVAAGAYIGYKEIGKRTNVLEEFRLVRLFEEIDKQFPNFSDQVGEFDYGYTRNMVFDIKYLKEAFSDITSIKDGLRGFWSKVNSDLGGFNNFQITQDINNDGRIGITDSNYLNPLEKAEDLLEKKKQSKIEDFAEDKKLIDKMFFFPIHSEYSIVRDFGLSLQLTDKAASLAAIGTNSETGDVDSTYHYDEGISAFSQLTAQNMAEGQREKINESFNPTLKQEKRKQQLEDLVVTGIKTAFSDNNKQGISSDIDIANQNPQAALKFNDGGIKFGEISEVAKSISEINQKIKSNKGEEAGDSDSGDKLLSDFKYDDFGIMKARFRKQLLSDLVKGDSTDDTEKSNYNLNKPIIPIELTMTLDGIGGLIVGNLFRIDYLPELYRKYCYFFISQVGHQVGVGGWTTSITAKMKLDRVKMIKDGLLMKKVDDRPKMKGFSEKLTESKSKGKEFMEHDGVIYKLSSDSTGTKTLIEIQEPGENASPKDEQNLVQRSYSDKLKDNAKSAIGVVSPVGLNVATTVSKGISHIKKYGG